MELALSDFERLLGQSFEVPSEVDGEVYTRLVLNEVSRLPHRHPSRPEPFSLTFNGPSERPLDQGTYCLSHETAGDLEIFIVPIGESDQIRRYQAVFN